MAQCPSDTLNAPADKLLLVQLIKLGGHSAISGRYTQISQQRMSEIKDKIDWKVIDQLHASTIEFSRNCSTVKKLCVTLLIASCTLLAKFNNNSLDLSFFVAGFIIPVFFWGLDASSYFYQEKLRGVINERLNNIKDRDSDDGIKTPEGITLEINRTSENRVARSIFNSSMLLYYILIALDVILFGVFKIGLI